MAISVKPDLLSGASASYTVANQFVVRCFQVSGLRDLPESARVPASITAVDALNPSIKIPAVNDAHPDYPLLLVVEVKTETADNDDVINVYVTYQWRLYPSTYLKSVHGMLRQEERFTSSVQYTPTGSSYPYNVPVAYTASLIEGTVSFKMLEMRDPEYFNSHFAGCLNSQVWRGYGARTMRLLPVIGSSDDNRWYSNVYSMDFRPETHDQYLVYRNPYGIVPIEVASDIVYDGSKTSGNGWKRYYDPNKVVNFNFLLPNFDALPLTYGFDADGLLGT